MSLWFIVGVIVAVVVIIVVLAVVIIICCRKDRHRGRVFKQKKNKPRSGGQGRLLEAKSSYESFLQILSKSNYQHREIKNQVEYPGYYDIFYFYIEVNLIFILVKDNFTYA